MGSPSSGVADGVCVRCGAPVSQVTAYLSELGPVCWPCSQALETIREQLGRQTAARRRGLEKRAHRVALVHAVIWGTAILVLARSMPAAVATAALAVVLAVAGGLFARKRWAFPAALILDLGGALAFVVGGVATGLRVAPMLVAACFSLSMAGLTVGARHAFPPWRSAGRAPLGTDAATTTVLLASTSRPRWAAPAAVATIVAVGIAAATYLLLHRPDPLVTLMRERLADWQSSRVPPDSVAGGPAARQLVSAARGWPRVAQALEALDRVWPDEPALRVAATAVNDALAGAALPYMIGVWPGPGDRPLILSHRIVERVPWRIAGRTVEVLRLRRVDSLYVDFAMSGVTDQGLPAVLLDKVEASLARDVPAAYGADRTERAVSSLNQFDRAALKHLRRFLDQRLGDVMGSVGTALVERDQALEDMRARLHDGRLQFTDLPEAFVLGDEWLASLGRGSKNALGDGPVVLATDLDAVAKADKRLRAPDMRHVLETLVELGAHAVEAHEARHAIDQIEPLRSPPPALFEAMPDSSSSMIGAADRELRAFLGQLHDSPTPVCTSLAMIMRSLYGRGAGRTPHAFATIVLLEHLDPQSDLDPPEQLAGLCRLPEAALRAKVVGTWHTLYREPLPPAIRGAPQAIAK